MNKDTMLSIVIINYKTPELTNTCIASIKASNINFKYEIIVIDNYSEDDSKKTICDAHPQVNFISNTYNAGFGRANNLGVSHSEGEYILLVNSDLTVKESSISTCYEYILSNEDTGVVSCEILNTDDTKQNFTSTVASYKKIISRNLLIDYLKKDDFLYDLEAVMGSFIMFKKDVFISIGMFDPDFFMYSEEIELCHRFTRNGKKIALLKTTNVVHLNGGSSSDRTWAIRQSYLSSGLLFLKVRGFKGYILYHFLHVFNFTTNFCLMWFVGKEYRQSYKKSLRNYFSNFRMYFIIPFRYSRNIGKGDVLLKLKQS